MPNEETAVNTSSVETSSEEIETFEYIDLRLPKKTLDVISTIADRAGVPVEQVIAVVLAMELPSLASN